MTTASTGPHGLLILDKPSGPTSHGLVAATRKALGTRKVGHAGTLDPMASGLMVLGVGHATRLLTFIVGADKDYLATIRLGVRTSTEDAEGETVSVADASSVAAIDNDRLERAMVPLRGQIEQIPSAVSAIKVDGKRAYQRVRDGEHVELAARPVTISAFEVLERRDDELDVRVTCSSGTYIRALARDLGDALGVGAHLTALRRTRVGGFALDVAAAVDDERLAERLIAPAEAARRVLPALELSSEEAVDLGHGKRIVLPDTVPVPAAAFAPDGRLIGVVTRDGESYRPLMNMPEAIA